MDPFSALIFSMIVSWAIMRSAAEAGVGQAKAEARRAADAIRKDLRGRRTAWAKQLNDRLEKGRKASPATAAWWGWAAARTGRGLYRAMRRKARPAESKKHAIGGNTGPFGRIFGAAWRGAKYARSEARRQRAAHEKTTHTPVGVCDRCGAVVARSALIMALTRFGRQQWMCATCRAAVETERQQDADTSTPTQEPEQDIADADVVREPVAAITQPEPETEPEPEDIPPSTGDTSTPPPPEPPAPATTWTVERVDETPKPQPAPALNAGDRPAVNTAPEGEGMPRQIAPARGGALARRNSAMTRRSGGEGHTHGQWHHATTDIHRRLEQLPVLLEAMLRSLHHESAGRSQVTGVMAIYEGAHNYMGQLQDMLRVVSAKEKPMVEAVTVAGGPDEIPNLGYFREI